MRTMRTAFWSVLGFAAAAVLLLMAALVLLAYGGVYVDPLRSLWLPWPPDWAKVLLGLTAGVAVFALTLRGRLLVPGHPDTPEHLRKCGLCRGGVTFDDYDARTEEERIEDALDRQGGRGP